MKVSPLHNPLAPVDLNEISIMWLPKCSILPAQMLLQCSKQICEFVTWGSGSEEVIISLSRNGRSLITVLPQGRLNYSSSLVNPQSKWLRGQHTYTYACILMGTLCSARLGWPTPPLLHGRFERSHPSRDQQTAVNPLLKILANPLGLLRIAKWTLCMPQICNYAVEAVNGAQTPDPLSNDADSLAKVGGN